MRGRDVNDAAVRSNDESAAGIVDGAAEERTRSPGITLGRPNRNGSCEATMSHVDSNQKRERLPERCHPTKPVQQAAWSVGSTTGGGYLSRPTVDGPLMRERGMCRGNQR